MNTTHIERELGSLQRAQVELTFGAGRLQIDSLSPDSPLLMAGDIDYVGQTPEVELREISAGQGRLSVSPTSPRMWTGSQPLSWQVNLSQRIPLELIIKTGASDTTVNLGQLRVEDLQLDVGASRTTVRFPQAGRTSARVSAGAADLTLVIPQSVAVRVRVEQGLSSLSINESRFRRAGDAYITEGFDQAANRLDLEVRAGVASVRIE